MAPATTPAFTDDLEWCCCKGDPDETLEIESDVWLGVELISNELEVEEGEKAEGEDGDELAVVVRNRSKALLLHAAAQSKWVLALGSGVGAGVFS